MTREEVFEKLTEVFIDVFDDEDLVLNDAITTDDIEGWDSLANINLIVSIENEFDFKFSMEEIVDIKTVGKLADVILEKISK